MPDCLCAPVNHHILSVTAFQQNCTLFWCERTRRAAIIDPGGDAAQILALVADLNLQPEHLLLTHGHLDHVGASVELATAWGLPITGLTATTRFYSKRSRCKARCLAFRPRHGFHAGSAGLQHGDVITCGDIRLDVLHCPGHTPGHVVYVESRRAAGAGRRCVVSRCHRSHRFTAWQSHTITAFHSSPPYAIGRRAAFYSWSRRTVHARLRASHQSFHRQHDLRRRHVICAIPETTPGGIPFC